nr:diguanylate cyclase [Paenibacillus hamazuiensis]
MEEKLALQSLLIERWADERSSDLRQLAARESFRTLNRESMLRAMNVFVANQSQFEVLMFAGKDGVVSVSTDRTAAALNISDRDYFKASINRQDYMSDVLIAKTTPYPMIIFSSPVLSNQNEAIGVVFGAIRLDTIRKTIEAVSFAGSEKTYLADRNGTLIIKPADLHKGQIAAKLDTPIFQRALEQSGERSAYQDYRGVSVIGVYKWTHDMRWCVIREVDQSEVYDWVYRIMSVITAITAIILAISYGAVVLLAGRVDRPIAFILQGTKIIRDGYYDYRIDPSVFRRAPIELQQLCDTFNVMSGKLKDTFELLERYAMIDPLTGLYNRRYLANEGGKLTEGCLKADQPVSVLAVDIDRFKSVNDTYGHPLGDRVLRHVAELIQSLASTEDIAARYGGEEFIVLCLRTGLDDAMVLAERLRAKMDTTPFAEEGLKLNLTVSIGVSSGVMLPEAGDALEELIASADKALYQAKQTGRNKVVSAKENPGPDR